MSTAESPQSHHPSVHVERAGHVATVTLDRPAVEERVHRRHVGRARSHVPRAELLGRTRRRAHRRGRRLLHRRRSRRRWQRERRRRWRVRGASATMVDAMRVLARRRARDPRLPAFPSSRRSTACASAPASASRSRPISRGAPTAPASRRSSPSAGSASTSGRRGCCASASACTGPRSSRSPRRWSAAPKHSSSGSSTRWSPRPELDDAVREIVDTIAAGPPIAISSSKRELDNASTDLARAGARDRGARAERQRADRRPPRSTDSRTWSGAHRTSRAGRTQR